MLINRSIFVTGGTGSFGNSFVALTLVKFNPCEVITFSRDEMTQREMTKLFKGEPREHFFIGYVRDREHLYRALDGVDSGFSMEPPELQQVRDKTERAVQAPGRVRYGPTALEMKSLVFRRTKYVARDQTEGEVLDTSNMRSVWRGHGMGPKYLHAVFGRRAERAVPAGTSVSSGFLS